MYYSQLDNYIRNYLDSKLWWQSQEQLTNDFSIHFIFDVGFDLCVDLNDQLRWDFENE